MKTKIIETKVIAGSAGAGLGAALGGFLMWLAGVLIWHAPDAALSASSAVAAVPAPVSLLCTAVLAVLGSAVSGYAAPHTPRGTDVAMPLDPQDVASAVVAALPTTLAVPTLNTVDTSEAQAAFAAATRVPGPATA